ncbi:MAG: aminoacyl-histidine dipeptidase [Vicingaceae bacterium]
MNISDLEPSGLWRNFANLNAIPRPSKKEERIIQFMKSFGEGLGLDTVVDHIGNVIISKPGSKGMENRKGIVLQGHLDMVHQKNSGTDFNFDREGIKMKINNDWVMAEGTTLGADNGIGVAAIMAILESQEIIHPPIEALFTIDEETGMTGANELKGGLLKGDILLNLDTEDDRELTIGCAGGIDVNISGNYSEVAVPAQYDKCSEMKISGLTGGHSGMDIILGRANANKLMNRILFQLLSDDLIALISIDGGGLRNAIPRESTCKFAFKSSHSGEVNDRIRATVDEIKIEFAITDPELKVGLIDSVIDATCIEASFAKNLVYSLYSCLSGIYRMSPDIENLVQTSNNLARVFVKDGKYNIQCLTRSAIDSEKMDLANSLKATFHLIGAQVTFSGSYPGWKPQPDAGIVKLMEEIYRSKFKGEPLVNACHAGLECGILGKNYPAMEMISFGPNIRGAHSPDEKVQITSVQKFWSLLLDTLEQIPAARS